MTEIVTNKNSLTPEDIQDLADIVFHRLTDAPWNRQKIAPNY